MPYISFKPLFLLAFTLILSACASLPDQKELNQRAENLALKSSKSPSSTLQQAKLKLQKAHTEFLAFYAPTYYQNAQLSYEKAQGLYKENADHVDIRKNAQLAMEWVDSGLRNKKIVQSYLVKSLENRAVLLKLKANELFPESFQAIEDQLKELILKVEQRQEVAAKRAQSALLTAMSELEITTIGHTYLQKTYTMLKQAQDLDAHVLLPSTYDETVKQIKRTEQYIRQHPRDSQTIDGLANDSLFNAERLFSLSRFAQQMKKAQQASLETFVLQQEDRIQRISKALNHKDITNLSQEDQSLLLSRYAHTLLTSRNGQANSANKQAELEKWKRKVALLQAEVRRLERQRP